MKRKFFVLFIATLIVLVGGLTITGKSAFAQEKKKEEKKAALAPVPAQQPQIETAKRVDDSFAEVRTKLQEAELELNEGILGVVKNVKFNLSKEGDPRLEGIYKKEIDELVEEQKRIQKEFETTKKKMDELIARFVRKTLIEAEIVKLDQAIKSPDPQFLPQRLEEMALFANQISNSPQYNLSQEEKAKLQNLVKEKDRIIKKVEKYDKDGGTLDPNLMAPFLDIMGIKK